jgi:hypothetical protein
MSTVLEKIKQRQREWAEANGIRYDERGYVYDLDDNLFQPLSPQSLNEFGTGAGSELDTKMKALHSSSALAANFFEYWRFRDSGIVAEAMGFPSADYSLNFEKVHEKPEGLGGIPPHLDLELNAKRAMPIAIEAKFTEPYSGKPTRLKKAYIADDVIDKIWGGLEKCRELAERFTEEVPFQYLDAPQLLKHIVGLCNSYGEGNFVLVYLWYDTYTGESEKHVAEIEDFANGISGEVEFKQVTYQEVFERIRNEEDGETGYSTYMLERYFPNADFSRRYKR